MRAAVSWKHLVLATMIVIPTWIVVFLGAYAVDEGTAGPVSTLMSKPFPVVFWMSEAVRRAGIESPIVWLIAFGATPVFWILVLERLLVTATRRR